MTPFPSSWPQPRMPIVGNDIDPLPMQTLDLAALATQTPVAKQFAIERLAPAGEVTLFTGPGSAGKSLLGQQLATAAAAGIGCLGLEVQACPAIYWTCEDGADQCHWRQAHLCQSMGVSMAELAGKLHLISTRGGLENDLATFESDGKLDPSPGYRRLVEMVRATGSRIVFLDNVGHLFNGNENDRGQVTRFINLLNRLAGSTGAAIILLGHPNKSGDSYSGSTAWLNAVRSQVTIDNDRDADGNILDPDLRVVKVGKANYTQKGEAVRFRWRDWAFVLDSDLPADTRSQLRDVAQANAENAAFERCLAAATARKRATSHNPGSNYAPKVFDAMPESGEHRQAGLKRAMERLISAGKIELDAELWRGPNRVMKQGIRAVEICTDPPARTPCTDLHETRGNPARFNPPIVNYTSGAALGSAAPCDVDPEDITWDEQEAAE